MPLNSIKIDTSIKPKEVKAQSGSSISASGAGKGWAVMAVFVFGFFVFQMLGSPNWFQPKIESQMANSSQYTYVTDITLNEQKNIRGKIYSYKENNIYSLNTTPSKDLVGTVTQNVISLDPERVNKVISVEDEESPETMVITSREQVLIYIGEDDLVYIQVSPVEKQGLMTGSPYRSRNGVRTSSFYRSSIRGYYDNNVSSSFTTDDGSTFSVNNTKYDSYATSARNSSVVSRQSSGGGTGYGK